MKIGPSETLQGQIQAQLQANDRPVSSVGAVSPDRQGTDQQNERLERARQAFQDYRDAVTSRRDEGRDIGIPTARRSPVRSDSRFDLSTADDLLAAEDRVRQLFAREAPSGRTSSQAQDNSPFRLGQIVDIRV